MPGTDEYVDWLSWSIRIEVVCCVPVVQGGRVTTHSYQVGTTTHYNDMFALSILKLNAHSDSIQIVVAQKDSSHTHYVRNRIDVLTDPFVLAIGPSVM